MVTAAVPLEFLKKEVDLVPQFFGDSELMAIGVPTDRADIVAA